MIHDPANGAITTSTGTQLDTSARRRAPRRFMAIKLTPWFTYDLDFCMWLQANFDRLMEELSCESR